MPNPVGTALNNVAMRASYNLPGHTDQYVAVNQVGKVGTKSVIV